MSSEVEIAGVLLGSGDDGRWTGRCLMLNRGDVASVEFDWNIVLEREEQHGDVVGFFHTHPSGLEQPSGRDRKTMRAWCDCFGKPLLCVIGGLGSTGEEVRCYLFRNYRSRGQQLTVHSFKQDEFEIGRRRRD